ncbi:peptidyl-prolyl cis-trans isomerase [Candidatus Fermentibacteria bacterium]|nr:peptidyl-prolyl cis-trans isomerase [Candidatus Fermentibacteria bacterium]
MLKRSFCSLVIGMVSLALACTTVKQPADEVLVEGDGIRITKQDFDEYLTQVPPHARSQYSDERLLDFYIKGELAYYDALRLGLDRDPKVRKAIDNSVKQLLQREYNRREIGGKMGITDAQVREYYELHKEEFRAPEQRKCWHILTRTHEDAERAMHAVLGGEDFRDVATRFSIDDATRDKGGQLGIFSQDSPPEPLKAMPAVVESLFALPPGHVSGVIESKAGFHVLKADPAKRMPFLSVDAVAKAIRERLLVPDSLVQGHYEANRESYRAEDRAQVRVVVVPRRADADSLRQRILAGEDMADLARQRSIDTRTSYRGGLTDWLRRGVPKPGLDPAVEQLLWDVPQGEIGPVVRTSDGYAVFRVERREHAGIQPLEAVQERIRGQLLVGARERAMEGAFDDLKSRYRIKRRTHEQKTAMRTASAPSQRPRETMGEEELFSMASAETDPAARLDVYRELVTRFPTGDRADDSQFMIGFVLMDELHDSAGARQAYRDLIGRFPGSEWADDAEAMLSMMDDTQVGVSDMGADEKATTAGEPIR